MRAWFDWEFELKLYIIGNPFFQYTHTLALDVGMEIASDGVFMIVMVVVVLGVFLFKNILK